MTTNFTNLTSCNTLTYCSQKDPNIGKIVCKNYQILAKINEGAFGTIYKAKHIQKYNLFAVKIEKLKKQIVTGETLKLEAQILQILSGSHGFPRLYYYVQNGQERILVETLLGQNLQELFQNRLSRFQLKTVLLFLKQSIDRLEYLHNNKYIHRDIKPENFLVGNDNSTINLIDFGLAFKYIDDKGNHVLDKENQQLVGTLRFTSIRAHQGMQQNRASDLESLGYLAIYFLNGNLPWMNVNGVNKQEIMLKIGKIKQSIPVETLCEDLPQEFIFYFNYLRNLKFVQKPDYQYLRNLFIKVLDERYGQIEQVFEWNEYEDSWLSMFNEDQMENEELDENFNEELVSQKMNNLVKLGMQIKLIQILNQ